MYTEYYSIVNLRHDPAYFCLHHLLVPREGYDHQFRLFVYLHLQRDVKNNAANLK